MTSDTLKARLAREPAEVECAICRHRQWLAAPHGRCDQCGSEIALFEDREAADLSLDDLTAQGQVAFLRELAGGLYAVIANRVFRGKAGS
jgi:hypothetical protein